MRLVVSSVLNIVLQDAVEKFLAARTNDGKREFLVKHKHTSYHHLTWLPEDVLLDMSAHNKGRVQRWLEALGEPEPKTDDVVLTVRPSVRIGLGADNSTGLLQS